MTKKQIVRQIASELKIDQTLAKKVVQRCLDFIIEVMAKEGRIELRNFGVFEVKLRAERKARNPKTNEEVHVPAKKIVRFQAGKNVVKLLQNAPTSDAARFPLRPSAPEQRPEERSFPVDRPPASL